MALDKVYYIANQTKIPAKNLNEIQDEIIKNSNNIEKIKNVLDDVNTMTFKGLLGSDAISDLPTYTDENPIKQGDTYVIKDGGPYDGKNVKPGDMFIATVSGKDVIWNLVPSANDGNVYANAGLGENKVILGDTGTNNIKALNNGTQGQVLTINNDGIPAFSDVAVKDGSVTTDKIVDNAITSSKIADKSITEEKLDDNLKTTINGKEIITNKVTSLSDDATDDQYPTAKAVNNALKSSNANINNQFNNALKGYAVGEGAVRIDDVSPIEHSMNIKVQSKNVIPYPYTTLVDTLKGVTITDNGDGSITLNGTATDDTALKFIPDNTNLSLIPGIYKLSGCPNPSATTYYLQVYVDGKFGHADFQDGLYEIKEGQKITHIRLYIKKNAVFENLIIKPQFERGNVATDYTPYVDPTSVTLSECGKNLINSDLWKTPITDGGITASYLDENDCFMLNGSATRDSNACVNTLIPLKNVPSMLSASYVSGTLNLPKGYGIFYLGKGDSPSEQINFVASNNFSTGTIAPVSVNLTNKKYISRMWFYTSRGNSYDNYKVKIQLEVGSNETAYEPYKAVKTFTPSADGTVVGVKNIYPTTTLLADKDNVVIDVEYNRDLNNPDVFKDFVKFTDYATNTKAGVVKIAYNRGIKIDETGFVSLVLASNNSITNRSNASYALYPGSVNFAVKAALSDAKRISDMTDEEKANARGVIGAAGVVEVRTNLENGIVKNCIYDLGVQTSLSLALPATANVGDWLQFDFMSGSTATTLAIASTAGILGYDLIPEINTIYSLYLDWGIIGKSDAGLTYGWRFSYSEYPINM